MMIRSVIGFRAAALAVAAFLAVFPDASRGQQTGTLPAPDANVKGSVSDEEHLKETADFWRRQAESGDPEAQYMLGLGLSFGMGVSEDLTEAEKWFRKSAEQGYVKSAERMGYINEKGLGVPQDYEKAIGWYIVAAAKGGAEAQKHLGVLYRDGVGVLQDFIVAHMWFNIASANGDKDARSQRDAIAKHMPNEQILEAQRRAARCLKSAYRRCD